MRARRAASASTVVRGAPFSPAICASLIARARRAYPTGPSASTSRCSPSGSGSPLAGRVIPSVISAPKTVGSPCVARREREADRAVEAVVVGDGQRRQPEARRFHRQLLGVAGAVEEGEVGVAVQLGVARPVAAHPDRIEHVFDPATGPGPDRPPRSAIPSAAMLLSGINHVAVLTKDTDRLHAFYRDVFDAEVFADETISEGEQQGRLSFVTVGPHTQLNVFELPGNTEAEHQTPMFGRGRIDHIGLQAASQDRVRPHPRAADHARLHRRLRHRLRRRHQPVLHRSRRARGRGAARPRRYRARGPQATGHAGGGLRARRHADPRVTLAVTTTTAT